MKLGFTHDENFVQKKSANTSEIMFISKARGIDENVFLNMVQIIDEAGNEVNCTPKKFIEIFDAKGLEGFIL